MFQCYSLKSSHSCLLPQSPKVCSLHLCLFCCLAYRVIVAIFLNSYIFINILYWCFSFWLTSLCIIGSSFIHLIHTWFKCILFNGWVIFHCVYVPQLSYPFICWWTSRLFPCPGYYKQCCNEHWGTCVSAFGMGENNSKWSNWQTTNLKDIQATYVAQFQKNKQSNPKMGQRTK